MEEVLAVMLGACVVREQCFLICTYRHRVVASVGVLVDQCQLGANLPLRLISPFDANASPDTSEFSVAKGEIFTCSDLTVSPSCLESLTRINHCTE